MCDGDHHCPHHQHDQHVWETRLDCKSKLSRNTQIFTWDCRPSCRHTARYLSWPVAAVQRDSTLKWAKSLGVEKGFQHFYSHRMWNQFKTLPKAQRTQGLVLSLKWSLFSYNASLSKFSFIFLTSRFPCCVLLALSWNTNETNENPSVDKLSRAIN